MAEARKAGREVEGEVLEEVDLFVVGRETWLRYEKLHSLLKEREE